VLTVSQSSVRRLVGEPAVVTGLFVTAVATVDISAFNIYRYLLVSDALLLMAAAIACAQRKSATVYLPTLIFFLFVVYLLSTAFAFFRPVHPGVGVLTWAHSAFLMIVYVPAATTLMTLRPDLRRMLLVTLLVSTTVQAAITVSQVAAGLNWQTGTRIPGAFGSVHVWTYAVSVVAIVAFVMIGSWRQKTVAVGCLVVIAAAEMFRKSRMLWIASVLGGAIFAFVQAKHKIVATLVSAVACVALAAGYALDVYHPAVQERITATLQPTQTPDLIERIKVVEQLTKEFIQSPVVGLGLRQSERYLDETPSPPLVLEIHNVVMHAAIEGGAVAALAIALMPIGIVLLWRAAWTLQSDARWIVNWLGASLTAIYIAAQLTPAFFEHSFYLLIAALASLAVGEFRKSEA
jgi:O-antigen ligase